MSEKIPTAFGMVTPAPLTWAELDALRVRARYIAQGLDPDNLPTIRAKEPLAPEFLAAREEYRERYEAILTEGEEKGFLDFGPDGDQWVKTDVDRWATVPNPEYDPDKPNPYKRNVIITAGEPE